MATRAIVLVLDPDPIEAQGIRRMLMAEGCAVTVIAQAAEASSRKLSPATLLIIDDSLMAEDAVKALVSSGALAGTSDVLALGRQQAAGSYGVMLARAGMRGALGVIGRPMHVPEIRDSAMRMIAQREKLRAEALVAEHGLFSEAPGIEASPDGTWLRRMPDGTVEMGVDVRHWYAAGKMLCVEFTGDEAVRDGQPYARLHIGERAAEPVIAHATGAIVSRNGRANDAMCLLGREAVSESWLMPLVRIAPNK